jgi:hypothetical protein
VHRALGGRGPGRRACRHGALHHHVSTRRPEPRDLIPSRLEGPEAVYLTCARLDVCLVVSCRGGYYVNQNVSSQWPICGVYDIPAPNQSHLGTDISLCNAFFPCCDIPGSRCRCSSAGCRTSPSSSMPSKACVSMR